MSVWAALGILSGCGRSNSAQCEQRLAKSEVTRTIDDLAGVPSVSITSRRALDEPQGCDGHSSLKMTGELGPLQVDWHETRYKGHSITTGAKLMLYHPSCAEVRSELVAAMTIDQIRLWQPGPYLVVSPGGSAPLVVFTLESRR